MGNKTTTKKRSVKKVVCQECGKEFTPTKTRTKVCPVCQPGKGGRPFNMKRLDQFNEEAVKNDIILKTNGLKQVISHLVKLATGKDKNAAPHHELKAAEILIDRLMGRVANKEEQTVTVEDKRKKTVSEEAKDMLERLRVVQGGKK
jgi:hypothetical protein